MPLPPTVNSNDNDIVKKMKRKQFCNIRFIPEFAKSEKERDYLNVIL